MTAPTHTTATSVDPAIVEAITDPNALRDLRSAIGRRLAALQAASGQGNAPGEGITPGCRVRLVSISPVAAVNLTGTVQADASGKRQKNSLDVLLDESSTEALRRDHRVENTRRISKPADDTVRQLLRSIPVGCMLLADGDS